MIALPRDRAYTPDHLWITAEGVVGVTAHLVPSGADVERVHLPAPGERLRAAEPFGALEIAKGTLDLFAPCDGGVTHVNERLAREPALLAADPYAGGWLLRIGLDHPVELLDAASYEARLRTASVRSPILKKRTT